MQPDFAEVRSRPAGREHMTQTEMLASGTGGCMAPRQRQSTGQESQNPTQHIPQANKRALARRGGIKHCGRLSQKQLCRGRRGQVRGGQHDVFKRVPAPGRGRDKAAPGGSPASACKGVLNK